MSQGEREGPPDGPMAGRHLRIVRPRPHADGSGAAPPRSAPPCAAPLAPTAAASPKPAAPNPLSAAEQAAMAIGMPHALRTARRMARQTNVLGQDDLESLARIAMHKLAADYRRDRGELGSFVAAHVSFALRRALKKEHRAAVIEAEAARAAGLARLEALPPCGDALEGQDEDAQDQLFALTSEMADATYLHLAEANERAILVQGVVRNLAPFTRAVVEKHYLEGKSFREIAAELNATTSKVYRTNERVLPRLRRRLRHLWEERR